MAGARRERTGESTAFTRPECRRCNDTGLVYEDHPCTCRKGYAVLRSSALPLEENRKRARQVIEMLAKKKQARGVHQRAQEDFMKAEPEAQ